LEDEEEDEDDYRARPEHKELEKLCFYIAVALGFCFVLLFMMLIFGVKKEKN